MPSQRVDDLSRHKVSLQKADWKSRYDPIIEITSLRKMSQAKLLILALLLTVVLLIGPVESELGGIPAGTSTAPPGGSANLQRFSRSHFSFSLDLYSALARQDPAKNQDGIENETVSNNLLFSPYCVSVALAIMFLGAGAGSSTALELRSALHLNNFSFSDVHDSYQTVLNQLNDTYYSEIFTTANGIFQQEGLSISNKYKRALGEFYAGAALQPVDFTRNPQSAMDRINLWARNLTDGKINNLLPRSTDIASTTRLVLASALSFRSNWLFRFDPTMTFDKGLFYVTSEKRYEIPMMVGRFKIPVGYSNDLECRIAELPFASRRISLFIILPDEVDRGLAKLEANMTSDNIKALFSTLKDDVVNVRLPRFRLEHQSDSIARALRSMGIKDVFDDKMADLSGMSMEKLHVSDFFHKTFLEVDEHGAEAPITSGLNRLGSFGEKYFEVDHPFVFFLWDYHSGILLFLGRVTTPEPWNNSSSLT